MISFNNVSFKYETEDCLALEQFSNKIFKGELVLILGASGCGKTTITRLINGLVPHFYEGELEGEVKVKDKTTHDNTIQSLAHIVGSVFQDPRSQFFATDVTAEIAFSCENAGMRREEIEKRITHAVKKLGITYLLDRSIFTLSSGEKQAVAIASVYAYKPEIIVMDEPSANLDSMATQKLKEIIQTLKESGFTIVISEHRTHYLLDLVDRVLLMKRGRVEKEYSGKEFQSMSNIEANKLGLRSLYLEKLLIESKRNNKNTSNVLEIRNLSVGYDKKVVIQNLNFQIKQGEILGIVGHNGVGKSTLLETICGLQKEKSGDILFCGERLKPKQRIKVSYLVMQDSDYQLFTESVENELYLERGKQEDIKDKATNILKEMDLDNYCEHHPASLSGGQKQRLSIAVAYMKDAKIICLDEPTSGLDYRNMIRVCRLLKRMSEEEKTLIVISHDYEFLISTCQKVLCIYDDFKTECFDVSESNKKRLMNAMQIR